MIKLPGLYDPHVHVREPGGTHKEDWDSATAAALAGGFTTILAMPNTKPPITDPASLQISLQAAQAKARCDYAQFLGAGPENMQYLSALGHQTAGLKMYLDQTFGPLRLDDMVLWMEHFKVWPRGLLIVAHAEGRSMAAIILMSAIFNRPLHLAHVSLREEILLIRAAKEKGFPISCEVTPHHLFLTKSDIQAIGPGRSEVRPRLAEQSDQDALWANLMVIDCFATDHAPHLLQEKDGDNPPPGFPGLETALPLLLTAVHEGRLNLDNLVMHMHTRPRQIFSIPEQPETWVEVELDEANEIHAEGAFTRCGWTPFEGRKVVGKLSKVILRGKVVYADNQVSAPLGYGKHIRKSS
jgi:carbamoyl-phosphate synthase/aspartate carbamoyltransferase/dihydroorotase